MSAQSPHFLLYSAAFASRDKSPRWKFVLQSIGGDERFSAADTEPRTRASRLELLAVVRGLEALDQPSRVTLLTHSRYVSRGIRRELNHWRERRWRWERFGKLVPIRDHDLWQRVDRALQYHHVECCTWKHKEPRSCRRALHSFGRSWSISAAFGRLRQGVLAPISAVFRPTFTRAA
jgi:ribonuclease HI